MGKKLFSIVLPIYGNEKNLPVTVPYIVEHLDLFSNYDVEIIMVCDGSPDNSWEEMKKLKVQYPDLVRIYNLTKNSYRQIAVACGIEHSKGDVIGTISADMQDPLEIFVEMLNKWENGAKLVAANRKERNDPGIGWIFSNIFHKFLTHINSNYPKGGFDCFLIDKELAKPYCDRIMKESFMPLVLLDLVKKPEFVEYSRRERKIGKSGYKFSRKLNTIITALVLETDRLFYWLIFVGIIIAFLSFTFGIVFSIINESIVILFLGFIIMLLGVMFCFIGLLGVSLYNWAKNLRGLPKYIVEECESDE